MTQYFELTVSLIISRGLMLLKETDIDKANECSM